MSDQRRPIDPLIQISHRPVPAWDQKRQTASGRERSGITAHNTAEREGRERISRDTRNLVD
jgi:hypothetical protein